MTLTLVKCHLNWYALKVIAKDNHAANFHGCMMIMSEKMPVLQIFKHFPSSTGTLTLEGDNLYWYALKGLATDYHYASLCGCIDESV